MVRLPVMVIRIRTENGGFMATQAAVLTHPDAEYEIWRVIMASSVGTMIEWYDFYIFGSLAVVLSPKFYPAGNDVIALVAYLSTFAPYIPTLAGTGVLASVYGFKAVYANVIGVFTHTVPVDAYRGAGRPESNYLVERLVDTAARELGIDRVEIRRRNMVPPEAMPHTSAMGRTYDSGDFKVLLDAALRKI